MQISEISEKECLEVLTRAVLGRLGTAKDNQPYIVPVYLAYDSFCLYIFSTFGKKIDWMRANPKVCVQVDEINGQSEWISVIANGIYEELLETQHPEQYTHARLLLQNRHRWWLNALAERRIQLRDEEITPMFFRIKIDSMSGLRALNGKEGRANDTESAA
jgi:nitroimidazol reductase NimA-like FMN-containing flavoprotein (pyridoxamine 5'-phosphate oxidase superfamily)